MDEPLRTMLRPSLPIDLGLTLGIVAFRSPHPCVRRDHDGSWWRATRTPLGPAATRFVSADGRIHVDAWGPGQGVGARCGTGTPRFARSGGWVRSGSGHRPRPAPSDAGSSDPEVPGRVRDPGAHDPGTEGAGG